MIMRNLALLALLFSLLEAPAVAQYVDQPLSDPVLEKRAQGLHKEIRCLVCQNQAIADSNAHLARQLRVIVRERLEAGDNNDDVKSYLVERYGDWVLMRPPFNASTLILWIAPFIILAFVLGGAAMFVIRRRRQQQIGFEPLDSQEEARLAAILDEQN
jgi:cytochrome c-type biogenesis protein CcmH